MRKGQTATEYLIILAVVIVIALIVVGVLGGIPGIGQSGQAKTGAAYWSTIDPISIQSWANSDSNGLTFILRNNGKNAYQIDMLNVTSGTTEYMVNNSATQLPIGTDVTLTAPTDIASCAAGTKYSYDVKLIYTDLSTNAQYKFEGSQKLEGTCAS